MSGFKSDEWYAQKKLYVKLLPKMHCKSKTASESNAKVRVTGALKVILLNDFMFFPFKILFEKIIAHIRASGYKNKRSSVL